MTLLDDPYLKLPTPRKIAFVQALDAKVDFLLRDLPDQTGARLFIERLVNDNPRVYQTLLKQPPLLADVLAIAAWSPLLATTLEQNSEYFHWLARERLDPRVRTGDELKESLARFALTNSTLNTQNLLARFRRRELLRTYLHDIRRFHTLVETTEERGRGATAEFCVLALGKLGSLELNYSSDIDLVCLYSDDGSTSGTGDRGVVTNREYFVKLSEAIARFVGQSGGEGAAYRV